MCVRERDGGGGRGKVTGRKLEAEGERAHTHLGGAFGVSPLGFCVVLIPVIFTSFWLVLVFSFLAATFTSELKVICDFFFNNFRKFFLQRNRITISFPFPEQLYSCQILFLAQTRNP